MIGNDLAALLVWQSNYTATCEAIAFGLLMVYAARTICTVGPISPDQDIGIAGDGMVHCHSKP